MGYRIPSEETLRAALKRVLARTGGVGSLSHLTALVAQELQAEDPDYRLGAERVRRVVARMNAVRTTIYTRRGDDRRRPESCPVCGGDLKVSQNRTLGGGQVALEVRCTRCPYWTGRERRVPVRYAFSLREWKFARRSP